MSLGIRQVLFAVSDIGDTHTQCCSSLEDPVNSMSVRHEIFVTVQKIFVVNYIRLLAWTEMTGIQIESIILHTSVEVRRESRITFLPSTPP